MISFYCSRVASKKILRTNTHEHTHTWTHEHTFTQTHKNTNEQIHKHTNTLKFVQVFLALNQLNTERNKNQNEERRKKNKVK